MPGIPPIPGQELAAQLAAHEQRLRAIESQQQSIISNLQGQPILAVGLQPGSDPAEWGLGLLNQAYGSLLAFFGEDAAGNVGLYYFDGSGNKQSQYDSTGLHFYDASGHEVTRLDAAGFHSYDTSGHEISRIDGAGLHVYNSTGTEEVAAGLLNASPAIYGLATLPYGGSALQMVGGVETYSGASASNVTNTSWVTFGSVITTEVGPSGIADVSVQSYLATGTGGQQAFVGVSVDSGTPYDFLELSSGAGGISGTIGSSATFTGLSVGTHTFQLAYKTAANGSSTCTFSGAAISVAPK